MERDPGIPNDWPFKESPNRIPAFPMTGHLREDQEQLDYECKKLQSYVKEQSFWISQKGVLADRISPGVMWSLVNLTEKPNLNQSICYGVKIKDWISKAHPQRNLLREAHIMKLERRLLQSSKNMEKSVELIFIPTPGQGHLFSTIEMAKILLNKDERLFATILLIKLPTIENNSDNNLISIPRLQLIELPQDDAVKEFMKTKPERGRFFSKLIELHKPQVRNIVSDHMSTDRNHHQFGGFVIDMFCTSMIEVANEFGLPTYLYYTSSASMLNFILFIQEQVDEHNQDSSMYKNSDAMFSIPGFVNEVPISAFPSVVREGGGGHDMALYMGRKYRNDVKGIIINTFTKLEPTAIQVLSQGKNPPVYPVGPVLHLQNNENTNDEKYVNIMIWLDLQPQSSVVFLCFGSMGSFDEKQVMEIAIALEKSEQKFLWSLRMRPKTGELKFPADLTNSEDVLPEGFLERTKDIGRVIGWAPQMAVLSHPAVGGFVTHCGWNSTLEGVWSGVLMGTWPLYAEQQMNAFQMVKELGMAIDIKMDYSMDFEGNSLCFVTAEEIESGIRKMMAMEGEEIEVARKKVKEMKEKSREAVAEGGSSYTAIGVLVNEIIDNIA